MQQMLFVLLVTWLGSSCVLAKPALLPAAPFAAFPGAPGAASASPFAAYPAAPLAISSSQRLDFFNQLNAAFAPPNTAARLVATPTGLAAVPAFPAAARLLAAAPGLSPFFF